MTDEQLPRGESAPLAPPPGAFEAVQRRAAARRLQRSGIAGVLSLALFAGAFALGGLLGTGTDEPDSLVVGSPEPAETVHPGPQEESPTPTPTSMPTPTPEPSPTSSPATSPDASPSATTSPVVPPRAGSSQDEAEHVDEPVYAGRVVDGAGRPVSGAWLITVVPDRLQAERIADDGTYEGQCGGPRELIAMWDASQRGPVRQPRGMRNLAATWVNGGVDRADGTPVPCPTAEERAALDGRLPVVTTALPEGGVLTGRLIYVDDAGQERPYADGANPGGGLYCKALFSGVETGQCADWDPAGGRYRFAGLPTGPFGLQGMYGWRAVEVRAGRTTELDWYECDDCRQGEKPTPRPTASPAP